MKEKRILSKVLLGVTMFAMTLPRIFAQDNGNYNAAADDTAGYLIDTKYRAVEYQEPIEYYNVDLSWDDLYWVFVFEGDVTSPTKSKWVIASQYNAGLEQVQDANSLAYNILYDNSGAWDQNVANISVQNEGEFTVNVTSEIVEVENIQNYTNPAELKIAKFEDGDNFANVSWEIQASKINLEENATTNFIVKPIATRYVNDNGTTASVTGEVKLTFTKTS